MDERLIDIESRIAFLEVAIDALSESFVEHQKAMIKMAGEVSRMSTLIRELNLSPVELEPPPPHY
ncbi:MAG: SlyX family protein [Gammaproteobacteria bacterium]|nr:SlyX family protein [Gammaproteobacteria bacterium]MBU1656225.1 SlyX family protein [Gammaproteobacteria bacterium]MBU1959790.1 SlyX family protein [Gammaproteobacteria bacterium]